MFLKAWYAWRMHNLSEGDYLSYRETKLLQGYQHFIKDETNAHAMLAQIVIMRHFESDLKTYRSDGTCQNQC